MLLQHGLTPLMHPAIWGLPEVAELLLSRGADKSKRDNSGLFRGDTALQKAQRGKGSAEAKAALKRLLTSSQSRRREHSGP